MRARKRLASLGYGTSTFRVAFACGNGNAQIKRTAGEGNRTLVSLQRPPATRFAIVKRILANMFDNTALSDLRTVEVADVADSRPRCRNGEILKDAAAVADIFFYRRECDRSTAFVQRQVFPPKSSVD